MQMLIYLNCKTLRVMYMVSMATGVLTIQSGNKLIDL